MLYIAFENIFFMKQPPFSLIEAQAICKEYQSLIGHRFSSDSNATIDCIAVSPFDQFNKNRFLVYYLLFDDAKIALSQDYHGLLYDVIIIAGAKGEHDMLHADIHSWLQINKSISCYNREVTNLAPKSITRMYQ